MFLTGMASTNDSITATTGQNVSLTCDFSGYLPGDYNITWTGPQGVVLTTSDRHTISVGSGLSHSQSGGSTPGPSVLSTLTISAVKELDHGTYYCSMMGNNNAQLVASIELSVIVLHTPTSSPLSSFLGILNVNLYIISD